MNPILEHKLKQLKEAKDYECWYLVKQSTEFDNLCYLVSFLKEYKENNFKESLQNFISKKISELVQNKPEIKISNNYRALRVAAFFGLITITSSKYEDSIITDTFNEITNRCNGNYEKIETYSDIIQRQIEKMYISSEIDEANQTVRKEYRLYPVMLLYKVLLELGRATGKYEISMTEYRYLVATTKTFEDFLETLLLIKLLRDDNENAIQYFENYRTKFDNRLIRALKQLNTLTFDKELISIKKDKVEEVAKKVFAFEQNPNIFITTDYLDFLGSTKSLFDLPISKQNVKNSKKISKFNYNIYLFSDFSNNRILFGAPGTGKSYTLNKDTKDILKDTEGSYERVTFHPNYSYGNFVGTYKPVSEGNNIIYNYVPGPFMRILVKALKNCIDYKDGNAELQPYILLIEEINRANVAAVFGEVFQLLDRNADGVSEYSINPSEDIKKYLSEELEIDKDSIEELRIPNNMFIWATMNSADQGVFPMDTAFKRRWDFEYIGVNDEEAMVENYMIPMGNSSQRYYVKWNELRKAMNKRMQKVNPRINEDKLLGPFFISKSNLDKALDDEEKFIKLFKSKVIMYLFEDAMKMRPQEFFKGHKGDMLYSEICSNFDELGEKIFEILDLAHFDKNGNEIAKGE